jgi:hypothetical protein
VSTPGMSVHIHMRLTDRYAHRPVGRTVAPIETVLAVRELRRWPLLVVWRQ